MVARKAPRRRAKSSAPSAQPQAASVALPRISKGKRPQFYDQVAIDQLMAIVTALTAEVSVAFDRFDTLERVLVAAGVLTSTSMESFRPSADANEARSTKREELLQRVFAVFEAYGANRSR